MSEREMIGWIIVLVLLGASMLEIYRYRQRGYKNIPKHMRKFVRFDG